MYSLTDDVNVTCSNSLLNVLNGIFATKKFLKTLVKSIENKPTNVEIASQKISV